jgi:K+-transporting ATPase A subunit
MFWTIIGILVLLWVIGLIGHIGSGLIHLLIVAAVVVFLWKLVTGRRSV